MRTINGSAGNPLVAKFSQFVSLSTAEIDLLERLCAREEQFKTGTNICDEGDPPRSIFVVTRGMACRYLLPDGRRQILTFLIPGDLSELNEYLLKGVDHSIGAIVPTRIAAIERDVVRDIILNHPRLAAAFWWSAMQESAMLRERIVAIGRRNARGRIAYLLCEQVWRQRAVGMAEDHSIRLPLTQIDLADALGLTAVHVNRVLQRFREARLINLGQRRLTLLNVAKLESIAGLKPAYLQLNSTPPETLRNLDELERDHGENSGSGLILKRETIGDRLDEARSDMRRVGRIALGHLLRQFGNGVDRLERLQLGDDTLFDEHVKDALAQHQGDPPLWIIHCDALHSTFYCSYIAH